MNSQALLTNRLYIGAMDTLNFGEWLEDQYQARGWTQKYFASLMGVANTAVSNWVTGRQLPEADNCDRIAAALDIDRNEVRRRAGRREVTITRGAVWNAEAHATQGQDATATADLRKGSGSESTEEPLTGRQATAENLLKRLEFKLDAVIAERSGEVAVRQLGRVPADALRWAEWEHEERTLSVPMDWLNGRSPDEHFILEASGDCLIPRGILSGSEILCRRLNGETPRHNQIVVVRIDDEYTLKVWCIEDGHIRLRDGENRLIAELDDRRDVAVIGVVVRIMTAV